LKPNHSLDKFKYFEVTTVLGREYVDVKIPDLLTAPNSDELLQDLAYTIASRGVVFFRNQSEMTHAQHKEFVLRIHKLAGQPKESGFHTHPSVEAGQDVDLDHEAQHDPELFIVSNARQDKMYDKDTLKKDAKGSQNSSTGWHSDIMYENVPADFSCLSLKVVPPTGGDTLWGSTVEAYERLPDELKDKLHGKTFLASQQTYTSAAAKHGFKLITENRGNPLNRGENFTATHPVIRTIPITGKNAVYCIGLHAKGIDGMSEEESDKIKKQLLDMIVQNHDLQVRFKWGPGDTAIWLNSAVVHTATHDVSPENLRMGVRATTCGEKPYFDWATVKKESNGVSSNGIK